MSFISSCSARVASPGIWIVNQSDNYIRNIKFNWNGYAVTSGFYADRTPSQGGSQNFILEKKSDLFGPVHLEWEDAEGKKIVKEFEFKKEQLPYFQNNQNPTKNFGRRTFDSIYFFLTQDDFKMFVKPDDNDENGPLPSKEIQDQWEITNKISRDYFTICPPAYMCKSPNSNCPINCKDMLPLYQPKNMPKINKARKKYEEQEKQRLENFREYQENKKQNEKQK